MTLSLSNFLNGKKQDPYQWYETEKVSADKTVLDMNKKELLTYAKDMYDLDIHTGTTSANIVKKIYEHIHGVEVTGRGRKKAQ